MRCIHCESENVIKNGFRINNPKKEKRERLCKKYFSETYKEKRFTE